jgi:large subunit ribosomal protein L29
MKQSEVKELTTDELKERMDVERTSLHKLKITHVVSPLENPLQIRDARRNVARIKSELSRRSAIENKG